MLMPIVVISSYLGGPFLFGIVLLGSLCAGVEYVKMTSKAAVVSYLFICLLIASFVLDAQWPTWDLIYWASTFIPLAALTFEVFRGNAPDALQNWGIVVAGGIYIGLLSYAIRLRGLDEGFFWLMLALGGTWICDGAAYCVGNIWGKHRLCPKISPRKTWEGAIGGIVVGMFAIMTASYLFFGLSLPWGVLLGLLIVTGATLGDLAESVIKRQMGVKDSGKLIPGHGGMLDRIDNLLFVMPIVYYSVTVIRHIGL
ncbi:MAG: phosphatidate cytidylyltransferase [Anaerolineales bacterium]